jgi:hypothetical protein
VRELEQLLELGQFDVALEDGREAGGHRHRLDKDRSLGAGITGRSGASGSRYDIGVARNWPLVSTCATPAADHR